MFKVVGFVTMKTSILILWAFRINIVRDHGKKGGQFPFFSGDRGKKGPLSPFFLWLKTYPRNAYYFPSAVRAGWECAKSPTVLTVLM